MSDPARVVVLAPNWLGDAVMALPALADVRRKFPSARLAVAARRGVDDLFRLVPGIDDIVTLGWTGKWWKTAARRQDVIRLRESGADLAILFPNSFAAGWLVRQAGIPQRWGYASDLRRRLLTRAVARPKEARHQGEYYQHLVQGMGIDSGPLEPTLVVPDAAVEAARALLVDRGWNGTTPLVTLAPGAAYGKAKQWIPAHVVRLVSDLTRQRGATCVLVGSRGDAAATAAIQSAVDAALPGGAPAPVIDLAGQTTLEVLAGVLALSHACVSNDSGAMHLAAAVGTPVVAIFGPTIEQATRPLTRAGGRAEVLTHPVWCRPCMLRECPIDHRCMTGISPARVLSALDNVMGPLDATVRLKPDTTNDTTNATTSAPANGPVRLSAPRADTTNDRTDAPTNAPVRLKPDTTNDTTNDSTKVPTNDPTTYVVSGFSRTFQTLRRRSAGVSH